MMSPSNSNSNCNCNCNSKHSLWFWCMVVLGMVVLSSPCSEAAYIVDVAAKDEECFYVGAPRKPGTLFGNYDLLDNSKNADPLSVVVMDAQNDRILYRSRRGASEGSFKVAMAGDQKVSLCVQNGIYSAGRRKTPQNKPHDGLDRTVGVQFSFEEKDEASELHHQNSKVVNGALDVTRELSKLKDHQGYMNAREGAHRTTVEKTFSRLLGWTVLEGITVILVALAQIMYFRRFLERRRYM